MRRSQLEGQDQKDASGNPIQCLLDANGSIEPLAQASRQKRDASEYQDGGQNEKSA